MLNWLSLFSNSEFIFSDNKGLSSLSHKMFENVQKSSQTVKKNTSQHFRNEHRHSDRTFHNFTASNMSINGFELH